MSCLSALVSQRPVVSLFSGRVLAAIALAVVVLGLQSDASAQSRLGYALSVCDPENLWPAGGDAPLPLWERNRLLPTAETLLLPQTQPFAVGYSLTGGYRPIYTGAVQPTGHQVTMTHGGNGYTYQPTYDYGNGYGYGAAAAPVGYDGTGVSSGGVTGSGGGVLVVSNPGTPYESRYGTSRGRAAVVNVAPVYGHGPYANYGADYIGNYGPGYESYGAQAAYTVETRAAPTVPANQVPTLAPGPSPKNLEDLPNPQVPKREF